MQNANRIGNVVCILLAVVLLIAGPLVLLGCAGRGTVRNGQPQAQTGKAMLTVRWPEPTRLVPGASRSLSVQIQRGNILLASGRIVRPETGGSAALSFERLPVGEAVVAVNAYPNADGTGVVQASALVGLTIVAGQVTPVRATLASAIEKIDITPTTNRWVVGQTGHLVATARNSDGEAVVVGSDAFRWESRQPDIATVDADGTLHPLTAGDVEVQATERDSGKSASIRLTMTAAPTPTPTPTPSAQPGFYVVSQPTGVIANDLVRLSADGRELSRQRIPLNIPSQARDLIVDSEGNLLIHNGGFVNSFSRYKPKTDTWEYVSLPAGVVNTSSVHRGGIDVRGDYAYLTDVYSSHKPDPLQGLIRINLKSGEVIRFVSDVVYNQVTVGKDGYLYAVVDNYIYANAVHVYDLTTLQRVRTIFFQENLLDVAVNAAGKIFATQAYNPSTGQYQSRLLRYSAEGVLEKTLDLPGRPNDLNLASDGRIIVGSGDPDGHLYLTDESLDAATMLSLTDSWWTFVSFASYRP